MNDRLVIVDTSNPDLTAAVDVLIPVSENNFRLANDKRRVSFDMTSEGSVKSMRWGASLLYPKDQ